jgi:outer membrane protein TolC
MRLFTTLPLLLVAVASLRAEAPSIQGTLPEDQLPGLRPLLKAAVDRSPSTILSSINVAEQEAQKYVYASSLWPSVTGNIYYSILDESVTGAASSTQKGLFYNFGITQPVFQWGAYKNSAAIGQLGVKIAQRQYADAYRLLAISIREQYLSLVGKQIGLRNVRYRQKIAEEGFATYQAKFDAGSASQAELQSYQLVLEQAKLDADRAAEDFAYSKRVFTRLVGIDDLPDESIPLEIGHPEYSAPLADAVLAGFMADGVESTFQSQVYQMYMKQQDLNYSIAKVRLLPKVNASATYLLEDETNAYSGYISQVAVRETTYSIAATWTIFDGFAAHGSKLYALENKRYWERTRKTYIDSTIDSISNMRHQLGFSARALSLSEVRHALIGAEVKKVMDDLKLGYASPATVEASTMNLYGTDVDQASARTDYFNRWTEFISLAGLDPAIANISPRYVR